MHRQQKTFTPSSLILPLLVTALVIFLASSANAQNVGPATELPPSLESLAAPREATLAPATGTADAVVPTPPAMIEDNNAPLRMDTSVRVETAASNTRATANQNLRADLSAKRTEWANTFTERREMLERKRAELASSTLERKAALNVAAQERLRQLAERSASVLLGAVERMKNVSSSLRERAEVMSSRGVDTVEAIILLDQIDDLLAQAETSLSGVDVNIEYALTSESPKETWVDTRSQFQATAEIVRSVRPLLQETVTLLRTAIQKANNSSAEPI